MQSFRSRERESGTAPCICILVDHPWPWWRDCDGNCECECDSVNQLREFAHLANCSYYWHVQRAQGKGLIPFVCFTIHSIPYVFVFLSFSLPCFSFFCFFLSSNVLTRIALVFVQEFQRYVGTVYWCWGRAENQSTAQQENKDSNFFLVFQNWTRVTQQYSPVPIFLVPNTPVSEFFKSVLFSY